MRTKPIVLIILMFFTVQMYSQVRKPKRDRSNTRIKFEFKEGVQKVMIPGKKSFLTMTIEGRNPKILDITRTTRGKSYKLKQAKSSNCRMTCSCNIGCWEDPKTKQIIGICEPCNADEDELSGQIEFLSPDMK